MHPSFIQLTRHPIKFRLFLLQKLPAAFFSGIRIQSLDAGKAEVTIRYKWFTTNPFRSTYFACLSMAAEMSTGILAMGHIWKKEPKISMLVTKLEADFIKKATGITRFVCNSGAEIEAAIMQAQQSEEAVTYRAKSTGYDKQGDIIAVFHITWSFKSKSNI